MKSLLSKIPLPLLLYSIVAIIFGALILIGVLFSFLRPGYFETEFLRSGGGSGLEALTLALFLIGSGIGIFNRMRWLTYTIPLYLALLAILIFLRSGPDQWMKWLSPFVLAAYSAHYLITSRAVKTYFGVSEAS